MKKQILIPTDFSDTAFNAIKFAFELFKKEECEFHILHTYFLAGYSTDELLIPEPDDAQYQKVRDTSDMKMESLKKKIELFPANPNHSLHFENEFGPLFDVLKIKVKKDGISLIVIGTRGATDDVDVAYGRNSVNIMEKVRDCPVLAIPKYLIFKDLSEIVFVTSFKSEYKLEELNYLIQIAQNANTSISILHIGKEMELSEKQRKNKKILENHFEGLQYSFHWLEKTGVQEGIFKFVDEHNSGMIAFVNKKHWFFGSVFSNPLVKKLSIHTTVPLLALHDTRN